jgi:hypothetical protein
LSHVRNARKKDDQNGIKERTVESGLVRSGGKPDVVFSSPMPDVCRAMIQAKCLTIPDLRYMVSPSISTYPIPKPSVYPAITVFIIIDSSALDVAKLERNEKVNSAIDALLRRIRNELYFTGNTGSGDGMPITKSKTEI